MRRTIAEDKVSGPWVTTSKTILITDAVLNCRIGQLDIDRMTGVSVPKKQGVAFEIAGAPEPSPADWAIPVPLLRAHLATQDSLRKTVGDVLEF